MYSPDFAQWKWGDTPLTKRPHILLSDAKARQYLARMFAELVFTLPSRVPWPGPSIGLRPRAATDGLYVCRLDVEHDEIESLCVPGTADVTLCGPTHKQVGVLGPWVQ